MTVRLWIYWILIYTDGPGFPLILIPRFGRDSLCWFCSDFGQEWGGKVSGWTGGLISCGGYDVCDTAENYVQQYGFPGTNAMESDFGVGVVVSVGVSVAQWRCPIHSTHRETLWRQKWADLSCVHVDKWPPYPTLLPRPPTEPPTDAPRSLTRPL